MDAHDSDAFDHFHQSHAIPCMPYWEQSTRVTAHLFRSVCLAALKIYKKVLNQFNHYKLLIRELLWRMLLNQHNNKI